LAVLLMLLSAAGHAGLPDRQSPGGPDAAHAGEFEFRINCAFCHGLGGRGGGRGPDLTRAHKRHRNSDAELFRIISNGIPGTAMPANGTNGQGVGMTDEEIWQLVAYIRSVEVKAPVVPTGNAAHGKELFFGEGSCSSCHMVQGKGGHLGPDLTGVAGTRTIEAISESVRNPSRRLAQGLMEATKEFAQEYETATVVTSDGRQIKGTTLNEDDFSVQIIDQSDRLHLFEKDRLRSFTKSRNSLMPPYKTSILSDADLQDIIAYLTSVAQ
jgi:cytochrome c oxidase cbb3-type subunit III